MVEIVGRDPKAVKRVTCDGCASILEYEQREVLVGEGSDYSGDTWMYDFIPCPKCRNKVDV